MFEKKIQTVGTVKQFMAGDYKGSKQEKAESLIRIAKYATAAGAVCAFFVPQSAFASVAAFAAGPSNACAPAKEAFGAFNNVFDSIMTGFDWGVVLVIVFAGGAWCLGHRGKALEILLGTSAGYILARHSVDIRNFLRCI